MILTRDGLGRATNQADSICCTVSRPLVAASHWEESFAILLDAILSPCSRSALIAIVSAMRALEAVSASAPTVKITIPTTVSISVKPRGPPRVRIVSEYACELTLRHSGSTGEIDSFPVHSAAVQREWMQTKKTGRLSTPRLPKTSFDLITRRLLRQRR